MRPSPALMWRQCRARSRKHARPIAAVITTGAFGVRVAAGGGVAAAGTGAAAGGGGGGAGDGAGGGATTACFGAAVGFASCAGLGGAWRTAGGALAGAPGAAAAGDGVRAGAAAGGGVAGAGAACTGLAGAGGATAAGGVGPGMVALTAVLQADDRPATFFCRHCKASRPPGVTPEHFAMKSDRHEARMALCCSGVTCASAPAVNPASRMAAAAGAKARAKTHGMSFLGNVMMSPKSRPKVVCARPVRQSI